MSTKPIKALIYTVYLIFSLTLLFYVILPSPGFPDPLPNVLQSKEMGDTETPLRRAYFTNATREEVMLHYMKQFCCLPLLNIPALTFRLNYPPEDSAFLIRDQTRSTFLEEIVHPLRESVYINGFEPTEVKDAINIEGLPWRQKVIVKYVPSSVAIRILVGLLAVVSIPLVCKEWLLAFKKK